MSKIKIYKAILIVLIISITSIAIAVSFKFIKEYNNQKKTKEIVTDINKKIKDTNSDTAEKMNIEIKGHQVIGIIKIPIINMEYPILETTTAETLNLSITKFWGNEINEVGNVTLAGHNNLSGVMFGKIKKLKIGDVIELTDMQNITLKYEIFKTYIIDPNDISCILPENEGTREITLITCTTGGKNRYIVKARQTEIQN